MLVRPGLPCAATQLDSDMHADVDVCPGCYIASQPPAPATNMQQNLTKDEGALRTAQQIATDTSRLMACAKCHTAVHANEHALSMYL